ncbi:PqqD family peptide modification chaperone [Arundinibacter roseus]|uniref:PqqD family protein n=1 Tax=Arundinibacter roseus TaxID=2070510 RepID=A0A4R4K1M0_9BACT|nr:PqqD family peptide modification chaperone [Arundinibacter roseus]TDB61140.1 PqqD family protein [Arundinibacter roseus]
MNSEAKQTQYRLTSDQVSSNLGGEVVILNHDKGVYYGLGEVGALVWSALENTSHSFEELCTLVMAEYEVDQETCEADMEALLAELMEEKLIEVV